MAKSKEKPKVEVERENRLVVPVGRLVTDEEITIQVPEIENVDLKKIATTVNVIAAGEPVLGLEATVEKGSVSVKPTEPIDPDNDCKIILEW
jgi:hypothetical protein